MRLKLFIVLFVASIVFPLQASAQTSTDSADRMGTKVDDRNLKPPHERRQDSRDAIQARKEEFKQRLKTLGDQKKRMIIERIDTRMASTNKKTTIRLASVLERIQSILYKIIGKAELVKAKGVDTAALDSATASAQIAIDNAKAVVASQSAMVYVIQIASESAIRENVGSTVSELRLDLRDAHKAVIDAKQAVMKAAMELAKFNGSGIFKDNRATNSAQ